MALNQAEYIWPDGATRAQQLRSKSRIITLLARLQVSGHHLARHQRPVNEPSSRGLVGKPESIGGGVNDVSPTPHRRTSRSIVVEARRRENLMGSSHPASSSTERPSRTGFN